MTIITKETIKTIPTTALLEFYNTYVESPVKKFRDRATAEARCLKLLEDASQANTSSIYDFDAHGFAKCPHCGVHLSNGIGQDGDEVNGKVIKHKSKMYACLACEGEFGPSIKGTPDTDNKTNRETSITQADTMKTSLKLDRTIYAVLKDSTELLGEWKNAFQMWKANQEWMTSGQQDSLTSKLYKAAKEGVKLQVEINGRSFYLKNI